MERVVLRTPAVSNQAREGTACRLEVVGKGVRVFGNGGKRPRQRTVVIETGGARLAVQVGQVQGELVDDLGLARERQRGKMVADVAAEIHAVTPWG